MKENATSINLHPFSNLPSTILMMPSSAPIATSKRTIVAISTVTGISISVSIDSPLFLHLFYQFPKPQEILFRDLPVTFRQVLLQAVLVMHHHEQEDAEDEDEDEQVLLRHKGTRHFFPRPFGHREGIERFGNFLAYGDS